MSRGDPLRVRDYLEHIAEAIANIREYTASMNAAMYLADRKTQDAVVRTVGANSRGCSEPTMSEVAFYQGTVVYGDNNIRISFCQGS